MSSSKLNLEGPQNREFVEYAHEAEKRGLAEIEGGDKDKEVKGKDSTSGTASMNSSGEIDPLSFGHPEAVENAYYALNLSLALTHPPSGPRVNGKTVAQPQTQRALDGYARLVDEAKEILSNVRQLRAAVDDSSLTPHTKWVDSLQRAVDDMVEKVARYQQQNMGELTGVGGAPTKYQQEQLAEFLDMRTELSQNLAEAMAHLNILRSEAVRAQLVQNMR